GAVTDRLAQIEPRVLLAVDGYNYGGKGFDRRGVVSDLVAGMPTVEQVVILPYLEPDPDLTPLPGAITWNELLSKDPGAELTFTRVPFDSPCGSSTPPAPPGCRSRSSRARAASCSST
ncbi:MAG TPA: hypothetical protein PLS38_11880, partial [Solirubrobacterales bacterium]|nr:hypothetical protein [Solirubrobacterales bacterium]